MRSGGKTSWHELMRISDGQNQRFAVTDGSFVVQHMRCNVSFPNKQPLLLQVGVKLDEGQGPRTTPGLLKTHNSPFVLGVPAWVNTLWVETAVFI